jgi:hypothetical protein
MSLYAPDGPHLHNYVIPTRHHRNSIRKNIFYLYCEGDDVCVTEIALMYSIKELRKMYKDCLSGRFWIGQWFVVKTVGLADLRFNGPTPLYYKVPPTPRRYNIQLSHETANSSRVDITRVISHGRLITNGIRNPLGWNSRLSASASRSNFFKISRDLLQKNKLRGRFAGSRDPIPFLRIPGSLNPEQHVCIYIQLSSAISTRMLQCQRNVLLSWNRMLFVFDISVLLSTHRCLRLQTDWTRINRRFPTCDEWTETF